MFSLSRTGAVLALTFTMIAISAQAEPNGPANKPEAASVASPATDQQGRQVPPPRKPEDAAELEAQSNQAYEEGNFLRYYIANKKLHNQRPFVAEYMINLVRACARLDKLSTAYHYMLQMQQQGLSYDFNQFEDTANIRGTEAYDYINKLMVEAGEPAGDGEVEFTLEGKPSDYSAIAWDSNHGRLLAGTEAAGKLIAVGQDGETTVLLQADENNGLWSIKGLAVDAPRNRLWISSSATPEFTDYSPAYRNRNALYEFDLDTMRQVARFNLPDDGADHDLGSVAVTGNGTVFVIDEKAPIVYVKTGSGDSLEPFVTNPALVSLSDIAVTPDDSRLYVADRVKGVFVVDPIEEQSAMLSGPENLNLGGITGIEYQDGNLYLVQGEFSPQRLMRLELDDGGYVAKSVSPMAIALPPFDGPGPSTLADGVLYYLANAESGRPEGPGQVMRTALDAGSRIEAPEVREILKQAKEKQAH
ncbi:MAG: hypothetical protein PVJ33_13560 [Lysobacterales bacterium]|jgi:hypothetical protein